MSEAVENFDFRELRQAIQKAQEKQGIIRKIKNSRTQPLILHLLYSSATIKSAKILNK